MAWKVQLELMLFLTLEAAFLFLVVRTDLLPSLLHIWIVNIRLKVFGWRHLMMLT